MIYDWIVGANAVVLDIGLLVLKRTSVSAAGLHVSYGIVDWPLVFD